jgi:tetratricopeptide (TPR) repeat protein
MPAAPPSEDSVARALEEYLEAAEAGKAPPREEFLARYPEQAEYLDGCLAALHFIGRAAERPRSVAAGVAEVQPPEHVTGQLGDFRLLREVGRGGMGVVYEAEQVSLGRRVALKVLPFAATMDPRHLQRFHNEARAAACLHHPHIVPVFGVGCERAVHFYAMQFIEGQTLAAVIANQRQRDGRAPLPEAQPTTTHVPGQPAPVTETTPRGAASTERAPADRAYFRRMAELGIQAAEALDHAHQLGIVHRDVKPANMLVDERGGLWVTDFGLAHMQSDARLTMTGDLVGTLRYMSPEQALAKRVVVDHRTDVYSLGATLYELLTLEPAFAGNDRQELLRQIAFEEPAPPRRVKRAIPAELETIVLKALEKNPADRYATARELADDLRRFLADEPIRARRAGVVSRGRKWARRHPASVAAGAAALTVAAAALCGAIGWVANDRATRTQRTIEEIGTALKESADWQERRNVPAALAAARRAQAALAGGHANLALTRRVEMRANDLDLLAKLEDARQDATASKDSHFDEEHVDQRCYDILRQFNLDLEVRSAADIGSQLRDSSVAPELASFLDKWALSLHSRNPQDEAKWKSLLDIARKADPDDWRTHVRDALCAMDREALVKLASSTEIEHLLPWTASALVDALFMVGAVQPAETLLRTVQQQHPDDFWTNEYLGLHLKGTDPPRSEEAVRYLMVATALRPQSAGAHINLGAGLHGNGDMEGAIAHYRAAIALSPEYALAYKNLGVMLGKQGKWQEAEAVFGKAIEARPDYAEAYQNLGGTLLEQGRPAEAEAAFRKAIALSADLAEANYNFRIALHERAKVADALTMRLQSGVYCDLSLALKRQGKLVEAEAASRKAIALRPEFPEAHNNLGIALYEQYKPAEAEAAFRQALALKPDAIFHMNLGNALAAQGKLPKAELAYRQALALKPDLAGALAGLGELLGRRGRFAEAETALREAIRLNPKLADAHGNLGIVLLEGKRDAAGAIPEFRKAVELNKDDTLTHFNLANALVAQGDIDGAIAEFREAIRLKPDNTAAHCNLAAALLEKGHREEAMAEYREAIRIDNNNPSAHRNLGITLEEKGDLDEAIGEYREAVRLNKNNAQSHYVLAHALDCRGQRNNAIAEYREAIRLDKDFPTAHTNLGNLLADADAAVAEYRAALATKQAFPEAYAAHFGLGRALEKKGRLDEAIAAYREAVRLKDSLTPAHYELGNALKQKGRLDESIAEYRKAIRLMEDFPEAHHNLAQALVAKNDTDMAIAEYRKALATRRDFPEAYRTHQNLGIIYQGRGQLDAAIAEYREAIRLKSDYLDSHVNLGDALKAGRQLDEAIAEYREAIRINPECADAHCKLGHTLRAQGKFAEALAAYRRGHELGSKQPTWRYPSAQWVRDCERMVEREGELPALLRGEMALADADEQLAFGELCYHKRLYGAAARLLGDALAARSGLADDPRTGHRSNAACAAALAGCGAGEDAGKLMEADRAALRKQSLGWLRSDLDAWRGRLDKELDKACPAVAERMQHWLRDPDFNGVRSPDALAKLPAAEREGWQKLWADVADLLQRAADKPQRPSARDKKR